MITNARHLITLGIGGDPGNPAWFLTGGLTLPGIIPPDYALLLDGVWLPYPDRDGVSVKAQVFGASQRGGYGALHNQVRALKNDIGIKWSLCTASERAKLFTAWADCRRNARLLRLPNGAEYTVVAGARFDEQQTFDTEDAAFYTITLQFSEA